jgi:predicted regulator of Ras-like GTPase activity (Roadblock/LC7/MglB family)
MASMEEATAQVMALDGVIALAGVDWTSGMTIMSTVVKPIDIELAAAVATEVVRAQMRSIEQLGGGQVIDDILITLSDQLHLITLSDDPRYAGLFSYLVLDRERGNLALARRRLRDVTAAGIDLER